MPRISQLQLRRRCPTHSCCMALVALLGSVACDKQPSSVSLSASASEVASGSPADEAPFALKVLNVRDCEPEDFTTLDTDQYLLGVQIELQATQATIPSNYYYGSLVDKDGKRQNAGFAGCSPRLTGPPLKPGQRAVGYINFRISRAQAGLSLEYAPRLADSEKARGPRSVRALGR